MLAAQSKLPMESVMQGTKPSINWDHVSPRFMYLACDGNGIGILSPFKMTPKGYGWGASISEENAFVNAGCFSSFEPGTCDWKESLIKRPK